MMLAQYALAHDDGTMYITGGGIESLPLASVPAVQPQLSLAVGVAFASTECGREHSLEITVHTPSGDQLFPPSRFPVRPLRQPPPLETETLFQFVLNMRDTPFAQFGKYRYTLVHNGQSCMSTDLLIRQVAVTDQGDAGSWMTELQRGYAAYAKGDVESAERIFRGVTEMFPTVSDAHNNLAFIALSKGRVSEALKGFERASELGYSRRDVLDFNIACSQYMLRDYRSALEGFERCVRTHTPSQGATLLAIDEEQLQTVHVAGPGDYMALAALNAGWSALRSGQTSLAQTMIGVVRIAIGRHAEDHGVGASAQFGAALQHLQSQLRG